MFYIYFLMFYCTIKKKRIEINQTEPMNYDEIAGTFYRIHRPYILQCSSLCNILQQRERKLSKEREFSHIFFPPTES